MHVLIVEFVLTTHCIVTQSQVKPELPDSPQLLHRDTTFSTGVTIYAKLRIARLPLGRYVPTLRSDSIFLTIRLIARSNCLMLSFLEGKFRRSGRSKCQHDDSLGQCAPIHLISTLSPPRYDMGRRIDGKFRGIASKIGGFVSISMFRGGRRQISRGADSKYQY